MNVSKIVLITILICFAAPLAARVNYAVIVGVSKYEDDLSFSNLEGTRNDALLVYQFLQQRGFAEKNISLLIEDSPVGKKPTRLAILSSLDQVVEKVKPGDFVYFHFSGHGSQQPSSDPNETDGMDEIILPADTGKWSPETNMVRNAITDDVIAGYVDQIRARQAFIWMVFDSCHSGTMTRGNIRSRSITRGALGIPDATQTQSIDVETSYRPKLKIQNESENQGGFIGFFAAQTNEETPEMPQTAYEGDNTPFGLFTFNLIKVLATYPSITYQQAAEQILKNYASTPWYGSTPGFTGTQMNARLFNSEATGAIKQWKLDKVNGELQINAGYLHQIGEGAIFAVISDPAAKAQDYIGYVKANKVNSLSSTVVPTSLKTNSYAVETKVVDQIIDLKDIPVSAYARVIATRYSTHLSISTMDNIGVNPNSKKSQVKGKEIIDRLQSEGVYPITLNWIQADQPSDLKLLNTGKDIYLLADYEDLPCHQEPCKESKKAYVKVALEGEKKDILKSLRSKLRTISKTLNLMRLSNTMDVTDLVVQMHVNSLNGEEIEVAPSERPILRRGDEISLLIANETEEPQDITVLFVDSSYGITAIYPREGQFNRFMPYDEKIIPVGKINVETTGPESMIVIANSVFRTSPVTNFSFLAQNQIKRTRGIEEMSKMSGLLHRFQNNTVSPGNKSGKSSDWIDTDTTKAGSIQIFQWITSP